MHFIRYLLLHNKSSLKDNNHLLSLMVSVDKEFESSLAEWSWLRISMQLQSGISWGCNHLQFVAGGSTFQGG